ncbi:hypothetical protein TIFTF001_030442 [Ficus carica]|uniref:Uncharacterized protein n=1 Tax=Ficus carica TaxID=3494 RepID=A0AA88DU42_FICCA|nr:hypothetical protein TIFTF001_030380 [Ficus carica]GMN61354.1 hypothetical protein TIFTF001_030442 [Ficus carica]
MYPRRKRQVVGEMKNADRHWQDRYFFMLANEKSLGALANTFYPLWGLLSKELRKPPLKALLFEKKLEQLLAQPNREWDEINVPNRLRLSSLWKDFVEIQSGMIKRILSWVDWPLVIIGALRRLFGTPLFIESLSDEEALIAELALDTMKIDFPSLNELLARKRAKKEAAKVASAAKAAHASQALEPPPLPYIKSSPEPSNVPAQPSAKKWKTEEEEEANVEVNLLPWTSLLQNKKLSVGIMRQLLTDVDSDMVNESQIQSHVDEFTWDGLKCILRGMRLIYHSTDKAVEQRERIKELEERGCSILNEGKEGAEMMKAMVNKFDEAKAKNEALKETVKQKDVDILRLVTRIVGEYERATLKAHYELLKEYRRGLLVNADVDEEIELFEESTAEVGDPPSAPSSSIEQVATVAPTADEPRHVAVERYSFDGPNGNPPKKP